MYLPDYDYVKIECVFFLLGKYYTSLRLAPISFLGHSALVAAAGPIAPGNLNWVDNILAGLTFCFYVSCSLHVLTKPEI